MAAEPVYREFAPRPVLRDFVHCVWTFKAPLDEAPQPIAPDGRCELIVQCGAPYREGDGTLQPRVLFAGQVTQPLTLFATGPVAVVGVRFRPEAARAFLGRRADTVTDQRVALSDLRVAAGADLDAVAELAQDVVETRVRTRAVDTSVAAAVAYMMRGEASGPPDGLSERQWQRRFKGEVGVSPRQFQSVLRFRRVFDEIDKPGPPGWVEAALAAGYFDQPQMARDFRRFLGMSSRQWAAQRVGLAKALTVAPETYKKS
jgi:crotonobetainyl-CoA:carnitine CoA-transferase CaiB-like acyl-CoA transferase